LIRKIAPIITIFLLTGCAKKEGMSDAEVEFWAKEKAEMEYMHANPHNPLDRELTREEHEFNMRLKEQWNDPFDDRATGSIKTRMNNIRLYKELTSYTNTTNKLRKMIAMCGIVHMQYMYDEIKESFEKRRFRPGCEWATNCEYYTGRKR